MIASPDTAAVAAGPGEPPIRRVSVLLYSDDASTRDAVRVAVGRRPARDVEVVSWRECATAAAVIEAVDGGGLDVLILDGEAVPAGGLGLCRQLKNEVYRCPPVLVLTGRPQDGWLATWSQADQAVPHPLDPLALCDAVAELARASRPQSA
jgi:DNA-binding response OmpR family regulator